MIYFNFPGKSFITISRRKKQTSLSYSHRELIIGEYKYVTRNIYLWTFSTEKYIIFQQFFCDVLIIIGPYII